VRWSRYLALQTAAPTFKSPLAPSTRFPPVLDVDPRRHVLQVAGLRQDWRCSSKFRSNYEKVGFKEPAYSPPNKAGTSWTENPVPAGSARGEVWLGIMKWAQKK